MTNRYQSLDVTLNLNNSQLNSNSPKKFANTIDFGDKSQLLSIGENDERVNKFRDLYFKNEKLRKQLKLLNVKLNEKLQKVKCMPYKKKKAMSVDLNVQKPSKALQRQLQNAYKQVAMYKKQIATLKIKQQSESTYQKYKTLQNQISYRDIEISQVQEQMKSIQNVKKIQDRSLIEDVQNEDLKQKLRQYQKQFKQGQQKLKQIAKKARKRQQQYKKQQAYLVMLQKKLRKGTTDECAQQSVLLAQKSKTLGAKEQPTEPEFKQVKQSLTKYRSQNQALQKRIDLNKKAIRDLKKNRTYYEERCKQAQAQVKGTQIKIQHYRRMQRDNQKKSNEQCMTGYNAARNKASITQKLKSAMKLDEIGGDSQDPSQEDDLMQNSSGFNKIKAPFEMSEVASTIKGQWRAKPRKVTFGFMDSADTMHKVAGSLNGLKAFMQESVICGLAFVYTQGNSLKQSQVFGTPSNVELRWTLQLNDRIAKIQGSLTQQGYLAQLMLSTINGLSAKFGVEQTMDRFNLKIDNSQRISGVHCAVRKLGKDTRITQLGFWLDSNQ